MWKALVRWDVMGNRWDAAGLAGGRCDYMQLHAMGGRWSCHCRGKCSRGGWCWPSLFVCVAGSKDYGASTGAGHGESCNLRLHLRLYLGAMSYPCSTDTSASINANFGRLRSTDGRKL